MKWFLFLLSFSSLIAEDEVICRNLQIQYDLQMLQDELAFVEDAYLPRRATGDHWFAIPLRNATGTDTQKGVDLVHTVKKQEMLPCKDSPFLEKLPYIASILDSIREQFGTEVGLVRLSKVPSLREIPRHRDGDMFDIEEGTIYRLHIPVLTGEDVLFEIAGRNYYLEAGNLYFTNVSKIHSVKNRGLIDRVHIVIDVHPTDSLKSYILQSPELDYEKA